MDHDVEYRPTYALLTLHLESGEQVVAEAGALVTHGEGIDIETGARGGVFGALKRALGGESLFVNTFTASRDADLALAPPLPGDVVHRDLADEGLVVQSGSYLASGTDVEIDTRWGGARTFFGGEGLFMLQLTGDGPVFLSSYGAIHHVELDAGERYTVDTGHIVAFEQGMTFDVRAVGGLKSTFFSGEGLVAEFEGPGDVWVQSRSQDAFISWLVPKLPATGGSGGGGRGGGINFEFGGR